MKVYLVGNPNAGKSTLFNRLTRSHVRVGNWHGVTVGPTEGRLRGTQVTLVDLPGIYAADGRSMEERGARAVLEGDVGGAIVFVAECATLPRALPLLTSLLAGRRGILVLTKRRAFVRRGGRVDERELGRRLGIGVLNAEAGREELTEAIVRLPTLPPVRGELPSLEGVWKGAQGGLTPVERVLLNGYVALPLFVFVLVAAFYLTFAPGSLGDTMKGWVEWLFCDVLAGKAEGIPSPVVRSLVTEGILTGLGTVLGFLPQILLLFALLTLLEESGCLSRLAALTDGLFAKVGMNGRAIFSLVMGFGCTTAAIATTRGLDERGLQRRTILCLPYISCSAKLPVYLTLSASFFPNPFLAVLLLYGFGVAISLLVARFTRVPRAPFVLELAPLQWPSPLFLAKSLLFQAKQFIIKTATVILAFLLVSWLLSSFDWHFRPCEVEGSMLAKVCGGIAWVFALAGMGDWRIAYAALSGLVAKENVAGALALLLGDFPYGGASAFALAVFVLTCSPCVSAIAATAQELGWRKALFYAAMQTGTAVLACYLAYFLACGGGLVLPLLLPVPVYFLVRRGHERVHRPRTNDAHGIHRQRVCPGVLLPQTAAQGTRGPCQRCQGVARCPLAAGGRRSLLHDGSRRGKRGLFRRL